MLGVYPRGLSPARFIELIEHYRTAAVARAELVDEPEPGFITVISEDELQDMLSANDPVPPLAEPSAAEPSGNE